LNHADLQQLAKERLLDAEALMAASRWSFAHYAAGYAVECALKACLLKRMVFTGWVFDDNAKKFAEECRTHDFSTLIKIAGMLDELNLRKKKSLAEAGRFHVNWEVVNEWKVTNRYDEKSEAEPRKLIAAIIDEPDGVMTWIRNYW
jgi:hypothetical protein